MEEGHSTLRADRACSPEEGISGTEACSERLDQDDLIVRREGQFIPVCMADEDAVERDSHIAIIADDAPSDQVGQGRARGNLAGRFVEEDGQWGLLHRLIHGV